MPSHHDSDQTLYFSVFIEGCQEYKTQDKEDALQYMASVINNILQGFERGNTSFEEFLYFVNDVTLEEGYE